MAHKGSVALIIHDQKILLLLRDNNPNISDPNAWQLPGGQTEEGESPLETVRRELEEEISMVPDDLRCLGKTASEIFVYVSFLKDTEVEHIKLGNEGQELKFFSLQDIKNLSLRLSVRFYINTYEQGLETLINNKGVLDDVSLLGLKR